MADISVVLYYCLVFSICAVSSCLIRSILKKPSISKKPIRHPPSPRALPIIGHIHLLGSPVAKSFQTLASRYGPLMRLRLASSTAVIVSNATVAKEILKDNEMNFVSRPDFGSSSSDYNIYGGYEFIFAQYGPYWRFMKKLCMTELLSVRQVNSFIDIRRRETTKFLEVLLKCAEGGKACDLGAEIMTLTNNVICSITMNTRVSANADESKLVLEFVKEAEEHAIKLSLGEIFGPLGKLDLFGYGRRLKTLLNKFDSLVERIMQEHEKSMNSARKERKDIMDILLEVYKDEKAEIKLSRIAIKSFLLDLFMAGTGTTGVAVQWTMAELINHPKVFRKLRDEINTVVGSIGLVQESDVPHLPYLQAVVKESLRLHPSAPLIFRRCEKDCKISGYDILANDRIIFNLKAIMRDPSSWENPRDFMPERFLKNPKENYDHYEMDIKGRGFKVFPFGSGRRGCPGASLALAVIYQVTATVVQCFDFEVQGGEKINMEEGKGFSEGMAFPLICNPITHINPLQVSELLQ